MDENLTLPPLAPLDDAGEGHITPFSQDDLTAAEARINASTPKPEVSTPRLITRMDSEGQAPRSGMGFGENVVGQLRSGSVAGAMLDSADLQAAQTGGANMANRGFTERQLAQMPTRVRERIAAEEAAMTPQQKQARLDPALDRVFEQAAFDLSKGNLSGASVGGALAAGLMSPENFVIGLPAGAQKVVAGMVASRLPSARPAIQAAIVSGVDAAFGNVVVDPLIQASRVQSGAQDKFDPMQTALAAPVGFAAGAAMRGAIGAATGEFRVKAGGAPDVKAKAAGEAPTQSVAASAQPRAVDALAPVAPPVEPAKLIGVEPRKMAAHSVATADGGKVDVAPIVVDASTLRASSDAGYDATIQPRDRTRAASDVQIREIAATLDPDRLGASAEADRGAPIIGPDAMVESGNGRVSAIRQAYAQGGEAAAKYRAWVESLGADTTGMKEPVLVRQRLTDMTPEERQKFAVSANQSATLSMSAPERAKADAGALSPSSLELIRNPDDFGAAANRDFLRAFSQTLPVSERAAFMAADGSVSAEGLSRARNAVLARAYEDAGVLSRITESTDDDVKSISSALVAVAPEWAKFRADIDAGRVRADVDQTKQLLEAVSRTADIRAKGMSLDNFLRQQDAFDVLSPEVQAWMAMFYRPDGKRAAGKDSIAERLRYYAQEARKVSADDGLFSDMPVVRAADLQAAASKRGVKDAGTETQTGLFESGGNGPSGNAQALRSEGQGQAAGNGSGAPAKPIKSGAPEAPRQLGQPPKENYRTNLSTYSDRLYREISADRLGAWLPNGRLSTDLGDVYFSHTADLALGQGGNRGIRIEVDAGAFDGQVNRSKPAWQLAWQNGEAEFIARDVRDGKGTRGALSAVEAPEKLTMKDGSGSAVAAQTSLNELVSKFGWTKTDIGNGRVRYERPASQPATPEVLALGQQPKRGVKAAIERLKNGEPVKAEAPPDVLPMAQRQAMPGATDTPFMRQVLDGETNKPLMLPKDAGPEEVHSFRVTEAIGDLAAQIGRKVEVDGRFTARGAAGEYKLKDGVIRLRQAGDFETFAHEAGHAIDQDLGRTLGDEWRGLLKAYEDEVTKLDTNTETNKTLIEGTAEFLRAYVTNPAYVERHMAPNFKPAFDRFIAEKAPGVAAWFDAARRASQIDSGMAPTSRMEAMQVSQIDPGKWQAFRETWKKEGLPIAFRDVWDQFNNAVIGKDQPVYRMVELLKGARYDKTGLPMPKEYTWDDPYKRYRQLPGAEQGALDQIWYGVRKYGEMSRDIERASPSLYDSIKLAIGRVEEISNPGSQANRAFNGYLIARRAAALYDRYEAGELRSPPIRASKGETLKAIADYEAANPQFKQAADGVFQWARASLERKRDAGIVSQEMFDAIVSKSPTGEYVPFYRDVRDKKAGGSVGGGDSLERSSIKSFGGSTRDILDPLQSLFLDAIHTERLLSRNDFVKSLHMLARQAGELGGRFVEQIPNSELKASSVDLMSAFRSKARELGMGRADAEIILRQMEELVGDDLTAKVFSATDTTAKGERVLFYWDGGERIALKVGNDRYSTQFFDMMAEMGTAERDIMMKMIGGANAVFTQLITNAPQFGLKNLVMDSISRLFIARNTGAVGRIPFAPLAAGIYSSIFDREFAKAYQAQGGIRGGVASSAIREATTTKGFIGIAERPDTLSGKAGEFIRDLGSPKRLLFRVFTSPADAIGLIVKAIESTETIGRVGQAKIVYNHLLKQGLSDAEAMRGAIFEARDVLDYDRFGTSTGAVRRFLPFLNVAFQGTSRANQNLLGDPARAVAQWNARGRDWSKVDPQLQTSMTDAVQNWGLIAGALAMTAGYHATMADSDVYQRASDYMKRRYWLLPMPLNDEKGEQYYISVPKPFDLPGALISAFEATLEANRRIDPEGWGKAAAALRDGFIPRQLESIPSFLSSQPQFKAAMELTVGKTIPFEGAKPRDIVPQALRSLPPDQQITGNTSELAKKLGIQFGVSPMKIDHTINSLGGTAGRDINDALTAAFGDNPNMTPQDAFTKMFFGGLYRRQRGVGEPGNGVREAMGADGGKYVIAANGYRRALELGDKGEADRRFNQSDDLTKTVMVLRGHDFSPQERQLHPLERAEKIAEIGGKLSRDLAQSRVEVQDRSRKRGAEREFIQLDSKTARSLTTAINAMVSEDVLSGLKIANVPGYAHAKVIDTTERLKFIKALSPEVGEELEDRIKAAHILPINQVEQAWPEAQKRILQDRDAAKFKDLLPGVKLPKKRR